MKFYEFSIGLEENKKQIEEKLVDETIGCVDDSATKYKKIFKNRFNESENKTYTFISSINTENVEGSIVTSEKDIPISVVQSIRNGCELSVNIDTLKMEECSSHTFGERYDDARGSGYVPRIAEIIEFFPSFGEVFDTHLCGIFQRTGWYNEKIVNCEEREVLEEKAQKILWAPSLNNEIDRVYKKSAMDKAYGVPVEYLFCSNDFNKRKKAVELLISALYQNNRVYQKRYADVSISNIDDRAVFSLDALFDTYKGGTIVLRFAADARRNSGNVDVSYETIKKSYGSLGQGVYLIHDRKELNSIMEEVKTEPHLYQEFIKNSYGKDIRVMVVGDEVVGAMLRQSKGDFRSNLGAGGKGTPFKMTKQMKAISKKIAEIMNLDYCGIDFLIGDDNELVVCEVNSNAFFHGFEQSTKINVAKKYVDFILKTIST